MFIGFIIYETADIVYNVSRISKNIIYSLYNFYFVSDNINQLDISGTNIESTNTILLLENRIKLLEEKLKI